MPKGWPEWGGFWRRPSYLESYRLAASLLIDQGRQRSDYDDIGLPTFHLQRHATELMLKRLLKWCIDIIELRAEATEDTQFRVSCRMQRALTRSHDLKEIRRTLKGAATVAGEPPPPAQLDALVDRIAGIESSDHWARYDNSKGQSHHGKEVVIPVVELQAYMEAASDRCLFRDFEDVSYEMELYRTYESLSYALDSSKEG